MSRRYRGALVVFTLGVVVVAVVVGLVTPRLSPLPAVVFALAAYGAAVLLDVLPPGRPNARERMDAGVSRLRAGRPPQETVRPRTNVESAALVAMAGVAVLMGTVTMIAAWEANDEGLAERYAADLEAATVEPTQEAPQRAAIAQELDTPEPEPTPEPTPTAEPTATPTVLPTPQVPDSPFANCTHLGGSRYSCGDQPWRVICSPDGYFFDPEGTIPDPIPAAWDGWSETTLTERLEYIHGVCE